MLICILHVIVFAYNYRCTKFSRVKRKNFAWRREGKSKNTKERKGEMNGRDESFSVSIFREATGKKVDEIVPFADGGERRGKGGRERHSCLHFIR